MTILLITLSILTVVLWIWALIDIIGSRFENPAMKILWIVLIFIFPVLGSIAYFILKNKFTGTTAN